MSGAVRRDHHARHGGPPSFAYETRRTVLTGVRSETSVRRKFKKSRITGETVASAMRRLILLIAACTLLASCSSGSQSGNSPTTSHTIRVGFINTDPAKGSSWTLSLDEGQAYLKKKFGSDLQMDIVQPVNENADVTPVLQSLIRKGDRMIFLGGPGYQPFLIPIAKQNPKVSFVVVGPWLEKGPQPSNVASVYANLWEVRYLCGMLAGLMTKSNTLGFVAAYTIPSVVAGINAFELGARSVNPKAQTRVIVTGSWYSPPSETQAVHSLIQSGADVIAQHTDSTAVMLAAKQANIWGVGFFALSVRNIAPANYLIGSAYNWGPYLAMKLRQVEKGTFINDQYNGGIKDGLVVLGPINTKVPKEDRSKVLAAEAAIKAGKLKVFQGPLYSNAGKLKIAAGGQWSSPAKIYAESNFLVQGVIGRIEK